MLIEAGFAVETVREAHLKYAKWIQFSNSSLGELIEQFGQMHKRSIITSAGMILENFVEQLRRIASTAEELLKAIAKAAATLASWVQWIHVS